MEYDARYIYMKNIKGTYYIAHDWFNKKKNIDWLIKQPYFLEVRDSVKGMVEDFIAKTVFANADISYDTKYKRYGYFTFGPYLLMLSQDSGNTYTVNYDADVLFHDYSPTCLEGYATFKLSKGVLINDDKTIEELAILVIEMLAFPRYINVKPNAELSDYVLSEEFEKDINLLASSKSKMLNQDIRLSTWCFGISISKDPSGFLVRALNADERCRAPASYIYRVYFDNGKGYLFKTKEDLLDAIRDLVNKTLFLEMVNDKETTVARKKGKK